MGSENPYIDHLKQALDENDLVVDHSTATKAFNDFLRKAWRADAVILNWIENIPSRRMGVLQTAVFMVYMLLLKIRRVRIIWIKHNKIPHAKEWFLLKKMLQWMLAHGSDHIIIHSHDTDLSDAGKKVADKTVFIAHPNNIDPNDILDPDPQRQPSIDFLIWGNLLPYKGILEFLQFVNENPVFQQFHIHIAGKCEDGYWNELIRFRSPNTELVRGYVGDEALKQLFDRSRFILFTYNKRSVMSSGVLIESLIACRRIIAPDCGAFRDMSQSHDFVSLYDDFSGIGELYSENKTNFILPREEIRQFITQNSWENMGLRIRELIA